MYSRYTLCMLVSTAISVLYENCTRTDVHYYCAGRRYYRILTQMGTPFRTFLRHRDRDGAAAVWTEGSGFARGKVPVRVEVNEFS